MGIMAEEANQMDKGENSLNGKTNCGGLKKICPYRLIARCGLVTVPCGFVGGSAHWG